MWEYHAVRHYGSAPPLPMALLSLGVILSEATAWVFGPPGLRAGGRGVEWICCLLAPQRLACYHIVPRRS